MPSGRLGETERLSEHGDSPRLARRFGLRTRGLSTSFVYTGGVKLFHAAERHARRSNRSRSRLYTDGIAEHLAGNTPAEATEAMNRVVDRLGETATDCFVARAAQQMLEHAKW